MSVDVNQKFNYVHAENNKLACRAVQTDRKFHISVLQSALINYTCKNGLDLSLLMPWLILNLPYVIRCFLTHF